MKQGQFPEIVYLSDLNGENGFKIDGEHQHDDSGQVVRGIGDTNGDGYDGLLIGAYDAPSDLHQGWCYVVYGGSKMGNMSLSALNSSTGFKMFGEMDNDQAGYSLGGFTQTGDFNGDGYFDFLIGANNASLKDSTKSGRSYLIFGNSQPIISLPLADINGTNGFKMDGENPGDECGNAVSLGGDINGDNYSDIIISANNGGEHSNGRCYVIFGGADVGVSDLLNLTALNGTNGFIINGYNQDNLGTSVSWAGDVNADNYDDLLIGERSTSSDNGATYLIFGGPAVGNNGIFDLITLNGANGYRLDGENIGGQSGSAVSDAGDVNGDGIADFMIGAEKAFNQTGRGYVVFGSTKIVPNGYFSLSSLNGKNGFMIDGEQEGSLSSCSISTAGDMNGDGYEDIIIGAQHYTANGTKLGRSYVIFGGIGLGNQTLLALADLNGMNGFKMDGEQGGHAGVSVSGAGDVNGDNIADLLIGANSFPNDYSLGRTYVVFGDIPPVLIHNHLTINQNQTIVVDNSSLLVTDKNHSPEQILLTIGDLENGQFQWSNGTTTQQFSQQNISDGVIFFQHNGSTAAPNYTVSATTPGIAYLPPQLVEVDFDVSPELVTNTLTVKQEQSVLLTEENLLATHNGIQDPNLTFIITNITNGIFFINDESWVSTENDMITFSQQQIVNRNVLFYSQNSGTPAYQVSVSDDRINTSFAPASITFYTKPVLMNNQFLATKEQAIPLTLENINATGQTSDLEFLVSQDVMHGYFERGHGSGVPTFSFYQSEIQNGTIYFVSTDDAVPSYEIVVRDPESDLLTAPQSGATLLLVNNYFPIHAGHDLLITPNILEVISDSESNVTINFFAVTQKGSFKLDQGDTSITNFTQKQITGGEIIFNADSDDSPSCWLNVSDNRPGGVRGYFECNINFTTSSSSWLSGTIGKTLLSAAISGGVGLCFFFVQMYIRYRLTPRLERAAKPMVDGTEQKYSDTLLMPVAHEVFSRIKIGGFLGYISQEQYNEYVGAVNMIIVELEKLGFLQTDHWHEEPRTRKQEIIETIAVKTREAVGNLKCCSCRTFTGLFKAEATPKMIRDQAKNIAEQVQQHCSQSTEARAASKPDVRLTGISVNDTSGINTPLLS